MQIATHHLLTGPDPTDRCGKDKLGCEQLNSHQSEQVSSYHKVGKQGSYFTDWYCASASRLLRQSHFEHRIEKFISKSNQNNPQVP